MNEPDNILTEVELLKRVVETFREITRLNVNLLVGHFEADALLQIRTKGLEEEFVVEVRRYLTRATLGPAIQKLTRFPQRGLLVTDYVNPKMAERLRRMEVFFLDATGNAYLNAPPIFVFIKGNRAIKKPPKEKKARAFQPTGLRVIFALLCDPALAEAPYRDIADRADVALGTVGWVINDLKQLGYLIDQGKLGRRLVKKAKLLDRWVAVYPEQLRPKLLVGRFAADQAEWWHDAPLDEFDAYWGGEVAAAMMTQYLRPELVTVYVRGHTAKLQLMHRLKRDPEGNVELLRAFWDNRYDWSQEPLVPPLLAYADLLAIGNPRDIETAKVIYDREITRLIGED